MLLVQQGLLVLFGRAATLLVQGTPPACTAAVGCPVPVQDFGFVFAEFSEVLVRPLLDFELSVQ